ncbi:hypothetical protein M413DRAFT_268818 [Hebeloma cylindrosporum]|uniref:Uncharacterized protein n=1 Tax=Hebeloma cylindrosporum TaxID=76867 RepID=A0A0C2Z1K0_HEBCY|nr:hypothetical protein M413DRAFT_268818 [Hebeloma cylindrosporum h7]
MNIAILGRFPFFLRSCICLWVFTTLYLMQLDSLGTRLFQLVDVVRDLFSDGTVTALSSIDLRRSLIITRHYEPIGITSVFIVTAARFISMSLSSLPPECASSTSSSVTRGVSSIVDISILTETYDHVIQPSDAAVKPRFRAHPRSWTRTTYHHIILNLVRLPQCSSKRLYAAY